MCPLHHIGRGPPTSPPTPARRAPLGFSAAGNNAPRRVLAFTSDGATPLGPSKHGVEGSATVVLLKHLKGLAETRSGAPSTPRTSHSRVEISAVGQPVDNLALSRPARCAARRRLDTVVGGSQHTPRGDRAAGLLRPTRPRQSFSGPSSRIVLLAPLPLCASTASALCRPPQRARFRGLPFSRLSVSLRSLSRHLVVDTWSRSLPARSPQGQRCCLYRVEPTARSILRETTTTAPR